MDEKPLWLGTVMEEWKSIPDDQLTEPKDLEEVGPDDEVVGILPMHLRRMYTSMCRLADEAEAKKKQEAKAMVEQGIRTKKASPEVQEAFNKANVLASALGVEIASYFSWWQAGIKMRKGFTVVREKDGEEVPDPLTLSLHLIHEALDVAKTLLEMQKEKKWWQIF